MFDLSHTPQKVFSKIASINVGNPCVHCPMLHDEDQHALCWRRCTQTKDKDHKAHCHLMSKKYLSSVALAELVDL